MARTDGLQLYAAGSLKAAFGDIAIAYEAASGDAVATLFGPSGLLRRRIEAGERADVFASADMAHPRALESRGISGPVTLFARNRLCAIARPGLEVTSGALLGVLLDPQIRLGTSTPRADPSGDYAWALFARAEKVKPGAFAALDAKAMMLTGGSDSARAPEGRDPYGWIMSEAKADIFLTYRSNAVQAKKDTPGLRIVRIPDELSVEAEYGMTVLKGAPERARSVADFILSPQARAILVRYGFETR